MEAVAENVENTLIEQVLETEDHIVNEEAPIEAPEVHPAEIPEARQIEEAGPELQEAEQSHNYEDI